MVISLRPSVPYSTGLNHGVAISENRPCIDDVSKVQYVFLEPGTSYYYNIDTEEIEVKED